MKKLIYALSGLFIAASMNAQTTVFDVIAGSPNHNILEQALIQEGLNTTLSDTSARFTVFAPDDAAFNQLLSDLGISQSALLNSPDLNRTLLHHVVSGTFLSGDLSNGEVPTLSMLDVTVDLTTGVMIDDASVNAPNLTAYNGVVHGLDGVLSPTYDDVTEVIVNSPDHTILLQALQTANLVTALQDLNEQFTVFAPTNAAFNQYLTDAGVSAMDLLNNPDLATILLHHVVDTTVLSSDLTNGEVTTMSGLDVTVDLTMGVWIDSASVTDEDIVADNGAVHVIDYVLLPTYDDVTEVVVNSPDHTILLQALQTANLVSALQDLNEEFTVFAPTNAAFTQFLTDAGISATDLLNNPDLATILLHHVIDTTVLSSDLMNGEVTMMSGLDVTVDLTMGVWIDSAGVTNPNIMADNGAVHVVDYVLLPTYDDVTEVVVTSPNHTILLQALQTANLVSTLQDLSAEYTVFAPTDAAFTQFLSDAGLSATDLLNDPSLTSVLLHHVIDTTVLSTDLSNGEVVTLSGLDVTVDLMGGVFIDDAEVTAPDILADNGAVHVIDYVLLPTYDDVTEVISTSPDHTTLLLALQTANLVGALQDTTQEFTVFAPTDAAFASYLTDNGLTATDLLNAPNLSNILLHHVVGGTVLSTDLTAGPVPTLNMTNVTVNLTGGVFIDDAEVTLANIIADNGVVHVIDDVLEIPTATSINELENQIGIYPNPFQTQINFEQPVNGRIDVLSVSGQLIKSIESQGSTTLELPDLEPGTYFLSNPELGVRKVVKW